MQQIIIIEDNTDHIKQIKDMFNSADYDIKTITSFGNKGQHDRDLKNLFKNEIRIQSLKLIICDLQNGEGDPDAGIATIETIRRLNCQSEQEKWILKTIPILVYSKFLTEKSIPYCVQLQKLSNGDVLQKNSLDQLKYNSTCLINLFNTILEAKFPQSTGKIFISHSSKDKAIVNPFVSYILRLGLKIDLRNLFYSSQESTGVIAGDNIFSKIKEEVVPADIVFLMFSENYEKSNPCLMELGATWGKGTQFIPILLPDYDCNKLEKWHMKDIKAIKINDENNLDQLFNIISRKYPDKQLDVTDWNEQKRTFLESIL